MEFRPTEQVPAHKAASLRLIRATAATIPCKLANALVKQLCQACPLPPNLKHLKRVRNSRTVERTTTEASAVDSHHGKEGGGEGSLDVILNCFSEPVDRSDQAGVNGPPEVQIEMLPDQVASIVKDHQLKPFSVVVPGNAPETREHWTEWCKVWPVTWRVPDLGTKGAMVTPLTAQEQVYFERIMSLLFTSSMTSEAGAGCSSMHPVVTSEDIDRVTNAAAIVDPLSGEIIALSSLCKKGPDTYRHPLMAHAAMSAIEVVAERDRSLWPVKDENSEPRSEVAAATQADKGNVTGNSEEASLSLMPLEKRPRISGHPTSLINDLTWCELGAPMVVGSSNCDSRSEEAVEASASHSALTTPLSSRPYLCTGYDCFLVREPCIMCAMALVHSRVSRVIYCHKDEAHGALGGPERLHSHRSLNHHYLVYHIPIKNREDKM